MVFCILTTVSYFTVDRKGVRFSCVVLFLVHHLTDLDGMLVLFEYFRLGLDRIHCSNMGFCHNNNKGVKFISLLTSLNDSMSCYIQT